MTKVYHSEEVTETFIKETEIGTRCDCCGKLISDLGELQEMVHINGIGGYHSKIGDGVTYEADICTDCVRERLMDMLVFGLHPSLYGDQSGYKFYWSKQKGFYDDQGNSGSTMSELFQVLPYLDPEEHN